MAVWVELEPSEGRLKEKSRDVCFSFKRICRSREKEHGMVEEKVVIEKQQTETIKKRKR